MPIEISNFLKQVDQMRKVLKNLPAQTGAVAEAFFKDNFDKQGFQGDSGLERWKARKNNIDEGRAILVGRGTGNLKKGIRKFVMGRAVMVRVTGIAMKYADVHNFGEQYQVQITPKMRKYYWAMYHKTENPMYKAMALTKKKQFNVNMPQRKFIGNSRALDDKLQKMLLKQLNTISR